MSGFDIRRPYPTISLTSSKPYDHLQPAASSIVWGCADRINVATGDPFFYCYEGGFESAFDRHSSCIFSIFPACLTLSHEEGNGHYKLHSFYLYHIPAKIRE